GVRICSHAFARLYGRPYGMSPAAYGMEARMLTDAKIKAAKPGEKDFKLTDSGQLYLLITKAGGKLWRMNYKFGLNARGNRLQKTLTFGSYPELILVEARAER